MVAACHTRAYVRTNSGGSGSSSAVSQYAIVSYMRRPYRYVPTDRVCSEMKSCSAGSSAPPQSLLPDASDA